MSLLKMHPSVPLSPLCEIHVIHFVSVRELIVRLIQDHENYVFSFDSGCQEAHSQNCYHVIRSTLV